MTGVARDPAIDGSLALLREGYLFITNRCRRLETDAFETRLAGQKTVCAVGAEAAAIFYDPARMERNGAMPAWVQRTLLGRGGVQGLDGERHRRRKAMFMALMTPKRIEELSQRFADELQRAVDRWTRQDRVALHDEVQQLLCRAVCAWTGVPLAAAEVARRTRQMDAMIRGAGSVGLDHLRARWARRDAESWLGTLVERVRDGGLRVDNESPLARFAAHREDDALLSPRIVAVELLNLVRPTVAVATYITFAAHALHAFPRAEDFAITGDEQALDHFVHEVRRFYPFFPFAAARVKHPFEWRGHPLPRGRRMLLDLYATNHDGRIWDSPDDFRPDRFSGRRPNEFELVPQGGGGHDIHHRCAGEWVTLALMRVAVRFLGAAIAYDVPPQVLTVSLQKIPALPSSGFILENVRHAGAELPRLGAPWPRPEQPRA